jgi:hypothetical protein
MVLRRKLHLTKTHLYLVLLSASIIAVSSAVLAQEDSNKEDPVQLDVSAEEYHPVHFIPSDEDRERFLRIEQGSSCEINDLLYVQDTMSSNNRVSNSAILNHSSDDILMTLWSREISDSFTQSCEGSNE